MIAFAVIKILDVVIGSMKGCLFRERERERKHMHLLLPLIPPTQMENLNITSAYLFWNRIRRIFFVL